MADLKSFVVKALPWIGAAATGNVPALVAMAAKEVSDALGVSVAANSDAIDVAVAGATPDQLMALRAREMEFKERMQAVGFEHEAELGRQALDEVKLYVSDTADARSKSAGDDKVFRLGLFILGAFLVLVMAVLFVLYEMILGRVSADPGTVAVVAGLIGTIVGYFAANAQQVVSYFFGSSKGSKDNGDNLRTSLTEALRQLAAATPAPTPSVSDKINS